MIHLPIGGKPLPISPRVKFSRNRISRFWTTPGCPAHPRAMTDDPANRRPKVAPETSWSLISAAQSPASDQRAALDKLCRIYWGPLYAFARRHGLSPADAEDATQDFFARILSDDWLALVNRNKGRFRGYLYQSMSFHLSEARRRDAAQKRGGGARHLSIDWAPAEQQFGRLAATAKDPAQAFDRAWAGTVLDVAMIRLAAEEKAADRTTRFEALRPFLTLQPTTGDYERLAAALGLARPTIAVTVHRLGKRYRELIRSVVAETVADPAELDGELRHLLLSVSEANAGG